MVKYFNIADKFSESPLANNTPEFDLYAAVLNDVFKDAVGKNEKLSKSAIQYVESSSCKAVCDLMEIEHSVLKKEFNKFISSNPDRSR